jgi:hypothetical protein
MRKRNKWAKGPSRLSKIRRSERLWAIEKQVRQVFGVKEHLAHRIAIYILFMRNRPRITMTKLAEEAGHGWVTEMLLAIRLTQDHMGRDAGFAGKVRKLCP